MEGVPEESKAFANTVFLKKSMYYNMRSRIVKRHAGHVVRKARSFKNRPVTRYITVCVVVLLDRIHGPAVHSLLCKLKYHVISAAAPSHHSTNPPRPVF